MMWQLLQNCGREVYQPAKATVTRTRKRKAPSTAAARQANQRTFRQAEGARRRTAARNPEIMTSLDILARKSGFRDSFAP